MKIPFSILGTLVIYFVWASSYADVPAGVISSVQP